MHRRFRIHSDMPASPRASDAVSCHPGTHCWTSLPQHGPNAAPALPRNPYSLTRSSIRRSTSSLLVHWLVSHQEHHTPWPARPSSSLGTSAGSAHGAPRLPLATLQPSANYTERVGDWHGLPPGCWTTQRTAHDSYREPHIAMSMPPMLPAMPRSLPRNSRKIFIRTLLPSHRVQALKLSSNYLVMSSYFSSIALVTIILALKKILRNFKISGKNLAECWNFPQNVRHAKNIASRAIVSAG